MPAPSPFNASQVPSDKERRAHLLHDRQGLSDAEIARLMGVRRETANRYRGEFRRKVDALRLQFPDCACSLITALTASN